MHRLYPDRKPYCEEMLTTSDGRHRLWVGCFGNPNGLPVICLHGGPGSGTSPLMPRFFCPEVFNVLCFDQRGCGRSESIDLFSANTTDHLLLDLDLITDHFAIGRYVLFGGSWGATLALLYAMERPQHCLGLILRGIFLNTPDNLDWLYGGGAATLYPAAWADFTAPIGRQNTTLKTVFQAYQQLLHMDDKFTQLQAARAWNLWEHRLSTCDPCANQTSQRSLRRELTTAQVEHHYLSHRCFLSESVFQAKHDELDSTPMWLLHGANDHVCPVSNAHDLKALYPNLKLQILDRAGHCAFGPEMAEGLCQATRDMAALYGYG